MDTRSGAKLSSISSDRPPPPPAGQAARAVYEQGDGSMTSLLRDSADRAAAAGNIEGGHAFLAEVDLTELDERGRTGPTWNARTRSLSRSSVVFVSRRMCYIGRDVLIGVHLIDAEPVPLFGRVTHCEYEGDGLYLIVLGLELVPELPSIPVWLKARSRC